jgi:hypothetical protein
MIKKAFHKIKPIYFLTIAIKILINQVEIIKINYNNNQDQDLLKNLVK